MTDLEMIDRVIKHARKGVKSVNCHGMCKYRGPHNSRCFIGALIPDERYTPCMESVNIAGEHARFIREAAGISEEQEILAIRLQKIHDNYHAGLWLTQLRHLRRQYESVAKPASLEVLKEEPVRELVGV